MYVNKFKTFRNELGTVLIANSNECLEHFCFVSSCEVFTDDVEYEFIKHLILVVLS